jgi:hypothetical protein
VGLTKVSIGTEEQKIYKKGSKKDRLEQLPGFLLLKLDFSSLIGFGRRIFIENLSWVEGVIN